jgi:hypothetical protein
MSSIITFARMLDSVHRIFAKACGANLSPLGRPGGTVADLPTPDLVQVCAKLTLHFRHCLKCRKLTKMDRRIPPLRIVKACIGSCTESSCSKT